MNLPIRILVVTVVAGIISCSVQKEVMRERTLSLDEVMHNVAERNGKINTLRGDGSITIESPERSSNGGFELNLRKPDSVLVEFSGPFGIHFGTLMLARQEFVFYNSLDNKAVVGAPDGMTLSALFNLKMQFDEILKAFTGEFGTVSEGDTLTLFNVEDGMYVAVYKSGEYQKEYRIDGDTFVVLSYRVLGEEGHPLVTAIASQVEETGETAMPMLLRVIFPVERRSITIAYDDVSINDAVDCFFALPKQADVIYR